LPAERSQELVDEAAVSPLGEENDREEDVEKSGDEESGGGRREDEIGSSMNAEMRRGSFQDEGGVGWVEELGTHRF
jgi:hypothetical protein